MLGWLKKLRAKRPTLQIGIPQIQRLFRARYDAAVSNDNNRRHWANADACSADAAANANVRLTLRNKARYEIANNSYARGIVLTLANDTIGTGPRLQMLTGDDQLNRAVEREFDRWTRSVRLAEKLRTMRMARVQDGETFAVLVNNPVLRHQVKLDLRLIEADQVTSPTLSLLDEHELDGIRLDSWGNPEAYYVLREHPGGSTWHFRNDYQVIPASHMIHAFRCDRPGQHRGVPEITPALELFALLRDYTIYVLDAAKLAANLTGVLYTDSPANGEADSLEPLDQIELERNMLLTMPGGWKMSQVEPRQPSTSYGEFKKEILNEMARCLNMPFNIAACNSSGYNYASGRLDHQTYYKSIRVDQAFIAAVVLDPLFEAWIREAILVSDLLPLPVRTMHELPHQWFWDGTEHVDPAKEARAQETRLKNNTTTLAHEFARQGKDWEAELRQRAREKSLMKELGLLEMSEVTPTDKDAVPVGRTEDEAGQ